MNAIEFYSYRVPELREFLQKRGVNCSLSKRIGLVRLCELAVELNLEMIVKCDLNDYKVMDLKRRTVEVNGVNAVIPSPTEVNTYQKTYTRLTFLYS